MKYKCDNCKGKGGFYPSGKRVMLGLWITCSQCKGKGSWYTSKKSKREEVKRGVK